MPFTLAHPAFILPLRRAGLPLAALSVGAMVPDAPLFAGVIAPRAHALYAHTHSLLGLLTTDLLVGMLLWLGWRDVVRAPFHDALPDAVRRRAGALGEPQPRGPAAVARAALAVLIGAASHVLIDEFTHVGRWGDAHISWLSQEHAGLRGTQWTQYVGGVGGLLVIAWALVWACLRAEPRAVAPRCPEAARWVRWAPIAAAVTVVAVTVAGLLSGGGLTSVAYRAATQGVLLVAAAALVTMAVWHVAARRTPGRRGVPG